MFTDNPDGGRVDVEYQRRRIARTAIREARTSHGREEGKDKRGRALRPGRASANNGYGFLVSTIVIGLGHDEARHDLA